MTEIHIMKLTSSAQLLGIVNSKAEFTEQIFGFRLCKNFKSKAFKKDTAMLREAAVVSDIEGIFLLLVSSCDL